MTCVFHLQNCNYFSMYVFLPFWSLLQLSRVYSSLHRAGGRWDNSGSSVPRVLSRWVSPGLRQKRFFPCPQGRDRRVMGSPFSGSCQNMLMVSSCPCPVLAHKFTEQADGADKQRGHDPHLPPLPSAIVPVTKKAGASVQGHGSTSSLLIRANTPVDYTIHIFLHIKFYCFPFFFNGLKKFPVITAQTLSPRPGC